MKDRTLNDVMKAVRAFTGMMHQHGLASLDYADIRAFLRDPDGLRGRAFFGEGEAKGEPNSGRAMWAAEAALRDLKRRL